MWLPHESLRTNCMLQMAHEKFLAGGRARRLRCECEDDEGITGSNFSTAAARSLSAKSGFPRPLLAAFVVDLA